MKRFQKIAEQVPTLTAVTTKGLDNVHDGCYIVSQRTLEAFAAEVVRECLTVIEASRPVTGSGVPDYAMLDLIKRNVEGYFDVGVNDNGK